MTSGEESIPPNQPAPNGDSVTFAPSPLSTQVFAPDGTFKEGNEAWQAFWQTKTAAWEGYNIFEDEQLLAQGLLPFLQRGFEGTPTVLSPLLYDPTLSRRTGRARWTQIFIQPVRAADGTVHEVTLVHQDLTELKESEDRLRFLTGVSTSLTTSLNYEAMLQKVTSLTVPYLADMCFVSLIEINGYFRRPASSYARTEQEELARALEQRCDVRLESLYDVPQVARTGQARIVAQISDMILESATRRLEELDMLRELGVCSFMCLPLVAHNQTLGTITFVAAESQRHYGSADQAMGEELANRVALAVSNSRLYEEAQEANRAKDEFLILAAHELRTPLTVLLGYAHLLKNDKLDSTSRLNAVETVERNAWSLVQVVNDVVDISRMNAGKVLIDLRPITLTPIIEAAVDSVRATAESKAIRLEVSIDVGVGVISGDANRLQQVVWQLLSNAIKFTPVGGRVTLQVSSTNTHARITVSDNGIGINPQFLPHIFERFRQQDSTLTRSYKGLGMGLSIVRYLVEMHGGSVYATSAGEGEGAAFTAEFPLVTSLAPGEREPRRPRQFVLPETLSLEGLRVLVVESQLSDREAMTAVLSRYGALAQSVDTATAALESVTEWQPDVLIADMALPGEDGYSLIRQARSLTLEAGGQTPAIAITSHMRTVDRLRALSAGYQAHMAKPIIAHDLAATVASLTGRITTNN